MQVTQSGRRDKREKTDLDGERWSDTPKNMNVYRNFMDQYIYILTPRWHIWTVDTIHYLQDSWQDVLWCFLLYGTEARWHFNIMVPIMHSSVHRLWTSSQERCDSQEWYHDMYLKLLLYLWWERLTFSIWINRGLKEVKGDNYGLYSLFLFLFTDGN